MIDKLETLMKEAIPPNPEKGWLKTALEIQKNKTWSKDAMVIAVSVLDALKDKGMTQKQLAKKLNVTPQAVNKIVKGKQNLTIGTIRKLEQALNVCLITIGNSNNIES